MPLWLDEVVIEEVDKGEELRIMEELTEGM